MGSISPHILLLEDELTVRILMTQILANLLDAQVTAFSSAEDGIEYLKQPDTRVDLIITDIQMVGLLDGYDVARFSLRHCPSTPVVITSGLNGPERRKPPENSTFLAKPWDLATLEGTLRALLERRTPGGEEEP
ncbi:MULTISPECIES: response regulator [Pseudomonas nitroreducens/multiresinivorans group]|uniref:Response regulator n=1 Tax=Pseudomonas multiresinivorans TaxID=95301 RepID=A0A7Z3BKR2_9PSED|nr:response regulator [Pseudomonas multiresinivorans]QJP08708.1 response regulator [Pseudomonas multiresinivorans]